MKRFCRLKINSNQHNSIIYTVRFPKHGFFLKKELLIFEFPWKQSYWSSKYWATELYTDISRRAYTGDVANSLLLRYLLQKQRNVVERINNDIIILLAKRNCFTAKKIIALVSLFMYLFIFSWYGVDWQAE